MNAQPKGPLMLSILIITVGTGWLLTVRGFGPGVNWVWTLGLGACGIGAFVVSGGIDKVSIVAGPFLLIGSLLSILRQTDSLALDTEVPLLVITMGVLSLIAQSPRVPAPKWLIPLPTGSQSP